MGWLPSDTQTLSNHASSLTFTAASAVRNNGVLVLGGGNLSGSNGVTIASGGELRLVGSATKTFSTLRLLNQGTVSWLDGHIQSDSIARLTGATTTRSVTRTAGPPIDSFSSKP